MERNKFINEIIGLDEIIKKYEDEAYFENENYILIVSDKKFQFREKITNKIFSIEYEIEDDNYYHEYTDEQNETFALCISKAEEYGFFI